MNLICFTPVDRRLDEWVSINRVFQVPKTHVDPLLKDMKVTRNMKRKLQGPVANLSDDLLEREREEITKVKNIQQIIIGGFMMDTVNLHHCLLNYLVYSRFTISGTIHLFQRSTEIWNECTFVNTV